MPPTNAGLLGWKVTTPGGEGRRFLRHRSPEAAASEAAVYPTAMVLDEQQARENVPERTDVSTPLLERRSSDDQTYAGWLDEEGVQRVAAEVRQELTPDNRGNRTCVIQVDGDHVLTLKDSTSKFELLSKNGTNITTKRSPFLEEWLSPR